MLSPCPRALSENGAFVFVGERPSPAASVPAWLAARMLGLRNSHGKPNADVLRQYAVAPRPQRPGEYWQIDFPAGMSEPEAALYAQPFRHLSRNIRLKRGPWWINAQANADLRATLTKRERYLATPLDAATPAFHWVDAAMIPDNTMLAVARDDDFTHGILTARLFALWWREIASQQGPALATKSFPFPWPPATTLGALTAAQEELRHAVARAARGSDLVRLNAAVTAAYGWPTDLGDGDALVRLGELNRRRRA